MNGLFLYYKDEKISTNIFELKKGINVNSKTLAILIKKKDAFKIKYPNRNLPSDEPNPYIVLIRDYTESDDKSKDYFNLVLTKGTIGGEDGTDWYPF